MSPSPSAFPDCNENFDTLTFEDFLKRTKNSLEVPLEHADDLDLDSEKTRLLNLESEKNGRTSPQNCPDLVSRIGVGFDPDDFRVQRLDLLWRVQEGKPVDTGASVSDYTLLPDEQEVEVPFPEPEPETPVPGPGPEEPTSLPVPEGPKPLKGIQKKRNKDDQVIPAFQKKRVRHVLDIKNPMQGSQSLLDKEGNIITSRVKSLKQKFNL